MNSKQAQAVQAIKDRIAQAQRQDTPNWNAVRASYIAQANKTVQDSYNTELATLTERKDAAIAVINERFKKDCAKLKEDYESKKVNEADLKAQWEADTAKDSFYTGLIAVIDSYTKDYKG